MKSLVALLAGAAVLAVPVYDAVACGACFAPPATPTVVSGHRMVMSISPEQTVLWDQIQYQGSPEDFAWVLPVKPGARIEEATDAFFEALEATTRTVVNPPPVSCGGGSFDEDGYYEGDGCSLGCGDDAAGYGDDGGGGASNGPPPDPVEVVHQGSVGPYETVTLSTMTPGALNMWLEQHGYNVTPESQPVIDAYVAEGFDFIALRLQPGQGIQQMKPVRVIMPGATMSLPLRMVAIGTGAKTPIVLYLIGEGRYTLQNFTETFVDPALLEWDFATSSSNYETVRQTALDQDGGVSFLTSFALRGFFSDQVFAVDSAASRFVSIYGRTASQNDESAPGCSLATSTNHPTFGEVVNPCPAGEPFDSPQCGQVQPGEIDARRLGCQGAYDLSQALVGMRLEDAWVTRIEGIWPQAALLEDLEIVAGLQTPVSNRVDVAKALNPEAACNGPIGGGGFFWKKLEPPRRVAPWSFAFLALALVSRRMARLIRSGRGVAPPSEPLPS